MLKPVWLGESKRMPIGSLGGRGQVFGSSWWHVESPIAGNTWVTSRNTSWDIEATRKARVHMRWSCVTADACSSPSQPRCHCHSLTRHPGSNRCHGDRFCLGRLPISNQVLPQPDSTHFPRGDLHNLFQRNQLWIVTQWESMRHCRMRHEWINSIINININIYLYSLKSNDA